MTQIQIYTFDQCIILLQAENVIFKDFIDVGVVSLVDCSLMELST